MGKLLNFCRVSYPPLSPNQHPIKNKSYISIFPGDVSMY